MWQIIILILIIYVIYDLYKMKKRDKIMKETYYSFESVQLEKDYRNKCESILSDIEKIEKTSEEDLNNEEIIVYLKKHLEFVQQTKKLIPNLFEFVVGGADDLINIINKEIISIIKKPEKKLKNLNKITEMLKLFIHHVLERTTTKL